MSTSSSSTPGWDELVSSVLAEAGARLQTAADTYARLEAAALHEAARRLRLAENDSDWAAALVEAATTRVGRAVVLALENGTLRVAAASPPAPSAPPAAVPLASAPALAEAAESREPVAALRKASELGAALAAWFGSPSRPIAPAAVTEAPSADAPPSGASGFEARFTVFPIEAHGRVAALLYAEDQQPVDAVRLELLADLAGAMLDRRAARNYGNGLVRLGSAPAPSPSWNDLPLTHKQAHLKAQRAARVLVSSIRLYHEDGVQSGRREKDLYQHLQTQIDAAREDFRTQHLQSSPPVPDYFHLELLRTLAYDDESLLGSGYPGPLA